MAYLIKVDGTVEQFDPEKKSINEAIGCDCFCAAPLPLECGYSMYVDDNGLYAEQPIHNVIAEELCRYAPLVGSAVVMSHEEGGDDYLAEGADPVLKEKLTKLLQGLLPAARN